MDVLVLGQRVALWTSDKPPFPLKLLCEFPTLDVTRLLGGTTRMSIQLMHEQEAGSGGKNGQRRYVAQRPQ